MALSVLAAGCGGKPAAVTSGKAGGSEGPAYVAPPEPDTVRRDAGGVVLSGLAPPGARIRLARPNGEAAFATANPQGRWTIPLGPSGDPRIFGLSVTSRGRVAQAQGYLLVTPNGQAALLRAGASAIRIDAVPGPGLRSIDFDVGGGLEIAVAAPPRATVIVRLDGRQAAQGRADEDGRYVASLPPAGQPAIRPGPHQVQIMGDGFADSASFAVSPPAPLAQGPLHSQFTPAGLRVDWMTPGGGVQSTILIH
ncbi:MAG: hypothetical protein ACJ798_01950 [Phenylobacterium sp.]